MADLLRSWVRSLGVESECEDFEGDFANGYALGEVMHACGLQPDFAHFQDDSHPDAMINNFTRLHPTMTQLGVPFDARVANRVMLGEAGVVPQILYQVRMQVTGMERHRHVQGGRETRQDAARHHEADAHAARG